MTDTNKKPMKDQGKPEQTNDVQAQDPLDPENLPGPSMTGQGMV